MSELYLLTFCHQRAQGIRPALRQQVRGRPYVQNSTWATPLLQARGLHTALPLFDNVASGFLSPAICCRAVGYVFVFWFYLYLVQVRHFNLLRAAWLTTLPWACSLIAIPVGGVLSDWAVNHWGATWGRRAVPLPALLVASGLLVIGARTDSPRLAVTSLTLSTVLVLVTEGPFWATMAQISGSQSGVGGGVMNFGSNLGGMLSPTVTPWLAGLLGWETALSLTALLAVLGAALWMGVGTRQSKEIPG